MILSIDGFAAAAAEGAASREGSGGAPFGIEGTFSEKWRKTCEERQYNSPAPAAAGEEDRDNDGMDGTAAAAAGGAAVGDAPDEDEDDIVGDVRAAAAEGAAAAAAAAEAVTAATMAAAGGGTNNAASGDEADVEKEGATAQGDEKGKKEILGTGPIWEEMKALAESKRRPLKGVRRVTVRSGQVNMHSHTAQPECCCWLPCGASVCSSSSVTLRTMFNRSTSLV